jgi:hypothetical protein
VQTVEPGSVAKDIFANVSITGKEGFSLGNICWAPGGKEVIFSASTDLTKPLILT